MAEADENYILFDLEWYPDHSLYQVLVDLTRSPEQALSEIDTAKAVLRSVRYPHPARCAG